MKFAFCISGQPRTWKKCYKSWYQLFDRFGSVDTFLHAWDFNSQARYKAEYVDNEPKETPVPKEELNEMLAALQPKKFIIESKRDVELTCATGRTIAPYAHPQYYGIWRAAHLKRQYEIENDFQYDVVVRLRTDLLLPQQWEPLSANLRFDPLILMGTPPNTIFTAQNVFTPGVGHRVNDMFFFADSLTYDHAAAFYTSFTYIQEDVAVPQQKDYPPEMALYFYFASLGITNVAMPMREIKIMRDEEHLHRVGELQNYETA